MTAASFINHSLPHVAPSATVAEVLDIMADSVSGELPLVEDGTFLGILSEEILSSFPYPEALVDTLPASANTAYVKEHQHFYDVLRIAADAKTQVVGVVSEEGAYLGGISLADLATNLGNQLFVQAPGGVLVLSVKVHDYSLAEIARLVESNEAKILTSYVENDELDPLYLRIVVRINQTDLSRVIATLERFGYVVSNSFHQATSPTVDQERFDALMRYLGV